MIHGVMIAHDSVGPTLRISCEAVPPSSPPAGAQGGTSARHTGAALSFVSCIRLFGGAAFERTLPSRKAPAQRQQTRVIGVDQNARICFGKVAVHCYAPRSAPDARRYETLLPQDAPLAARLKFETPHDQGVCR